MKQSRSIFPIFAVCVFLTIGVLFLGKTGMFRPLTSGMQHLFSPLQENLYSSFHQSHSLTTLEKLQQENRMLSEKLISQQSLIKENNALRDQFQTMKPKSTQLLPTRVIGTPDLWPGVSLPQTLIINRGKDDGIETGFAVVAGNNLIGKVTTLSGHIAKVALLSTDGVSFLAKTVPRNENRKEALGVVKGKGDNQMLLDNVVLSDTMQPGDIVVTKGDTNEHDAGFLPDLIVGKITAVNKKASSLFQTAAVESLVDPSNLTTVFVVMP